METRIVIIPRNSSILFDNTTKVLHEYQNGEFLVQTNAVTSESDASLETKINQGIGLDEEREKHLSHARNTLYGLDKQETILAYVEFIGPIDSRWIKMIKDKKVNPLRYQPEHTYLCHGTVASFMVVEKQSFVLQVTPLIESLKPKNDILGEAPEKVWIIVLANREEAPFIIKELGELTNVELDQNQTYEVIDFYLRIPAFVDWGGQAQLLKHPRVVAVESRQIIRPEDEVAGLIIAGGYDSSDKPNGSYIKFLENEGISGEGVTIGIVDDGVDVSHEAFDNRIKDLNPGNKAWHGTFVAGHAAGCYLVEKDSNNFIYGLGIAPYANLLSQDRNKVSSVPSQLCKETVTEKGPNGAVGLVQNNSWGTEPSNPMDYLSSEAAYDSFVRNSDPDSLEPKPLTICFSSGNMGSGGLTRPKAAKNIIVTGNSENYRPEDPGKSDSDNINEVFTGHGSSSHGNCGDGRIRPHIVAPGEWTASAGYDMREDDYISPKLTWGGGSSGASPKTAGACALLIQWWRQHTNGQNPSPAMLRALIVNSAQPMNFREFIPNKYEGWGRLNIKNALTQDVHHTYVDQTILLKNRGDQKEWFIRPTDNNRPIKITLAWTDPPGPIGSGNQKENSAIVNKLALHVEVNGKTYKGNNFINGWSTHEEVSGAQKEGTDNLQNVYLKEGVALDTIRVIVSAIEITTNCITGKIDTPQQDFAMVITNGQLDQGYSPTDVFLLVDEVANENPNSKKLGDYWGEQPENDDYNELGTTPADSLKDANNIDISNGTIDCNTSTGEDESWWQATNAINSESNRSTKKNLLIKSQDFIKSLRDGLDLVTARHGNRILIPSKSTVETNSFINIINSESIRGHENLESVSKSTGELSNSLESLMKEWDKFGGANDKLPLIRSRSAVLVVGSSTRVSRKDLNIMRKLAFMGNLYLVSSEPLILSFLAQRIHRRLGVQYRLASNTDLGDAIKKTLAEASGAQQIEAETTYQSSDGLYHSCNYFSLVEMDRIIAIRVNCLSNDELPQIILQRPGMAPFMLTPITNDKGFEIIIKENVLQIIFYAPDNNQNWTGQWELKISQKKPFEHEETVNIWGWSGMRFNIQEIESRKSEASRGTDETMVKLIGNTRTTFSRCQIEPRIISIDKEKSTIKEATRIISGTVRPSRIDYEASLISGTPRSENEKGTPPSASSIGVWVPHTTISEEAVVIDLIVNVEGVDNTGNIFKRKLRDNLIKLEPRSEWRKRINNQKTIVLHDARISEINFDSSGMIKSILLQKGIYEREVYVSYTINSEQLSYENLIDNNLLFKVQGNRLIGVIRKSNDEPTCDER
ncbi:S8 family serine peptidase [Viridibacillus sp. NPDC093762]|uniref:S8 family serine peptidase n=1 Tax=Viridibacillus sp. NPDC093762 TaxID=3390720 RepID=UPI003D007D17